MIARTDSCFKAVHGPHFDITRSDPDSIAPIPDRSSVPAPQAFLVPGIGRSIEIKIASEQAEWEQVFQLLAANYRARGYEADGSQPFRFTPYHVLPDTLILVAKHQERVLATFSFVPDTSLLGLPMESIYGDEVADLRQQGRRLGEAISLADVGLSIREFVQAFQAMIKLGMQYHVSRGGDTFVITVNPRHGSFYQKVIGFVPLGSCRPCPSVRDHPAEAYLVDRELMQANAPKMYHEVFDEPLPRQVLTAPTWSPDRVRYFGSRSTQVDARTVENLLLLVEQLGSPPRWLETEAEPTQTETARPSVHRGAGVEKCGSWQSRPCSPIGGNS
jgi:hypothetical protein